MFQPLDVFVKPIPESPVFVKPVLSLPRHNLSRNPLPLYLLRDPLTGSKLLADCSKGRLVQVP